jgi:glycosyltransferase involved in cell wall biosynthesis
MAQLLAALTPRHRIAVLYQRAADEQPIEDSLRDQCDLVEEVMRHRDPVGSQLPGWLLARVIASLLCGKPLWALECAIAAYGARVRALAQTWRPDIVQIEYHVMTQYLYALDNCSASRILVEHEPGAQAARERWRSGQREGWLVPYLDMLAWERFERSAIRAVQAVVVFTERDRRALARFAAQTPIMRIPLGAALPERALNPFGYSPPALLFVGNFIHPPNVDAAARLIGSIFPQVRRQYPELLLFIVGDRPPLWLQQMAGSHVVVTGRVSDVTPYLDRAALVVAPLRFGGGMRVKVVEALAAGKAVVASPRAVEGLDVVDGDQVALAESDAQFADLIIQLLADPERRGVLGACARAWACANLGWEQRAAAYEALYQRLIEQHNCSVSEPE